MSACAEYRNSKTPGMCEGEFVFVRAELTRSTIPVSSCECCSTDYRSLGAATGTGSWGWRAVAELEVVFRIVTSTTSLLQPISVDSQG
jgi:hypothetical protein